MAPIPCLLGFLMRRVGTTKAAVFLEFQLLRSVFLVLGGGVVSLLARRACESDNVSHFFFLYKKWQGRLAKPPLLPYLQTPLLLDD